MRKSRSNSDDGQACEHKEHHPVFDAVYPQDSNPARQDICNSITELHFNEHVKVLTEMREEELHNYFCALVGILLFQGDELKGSSASEELTDPHQKFRV